MKIQVFANAPNFKSQQLQTWRKSLDLGGGLLKRVAENLSQTKPPSAATFICCHLPRRLVVLWRIGREIRSIVFVFLL